jgi:3-phosphoinositide dependent protein kinase-1
VKQKEGGQVSLKSEVGLGVGDKGKEREKLREGKEREKPREGKEKERDASKDCRNVIESAEPKGEREFVILTVSPPIPVLRASPLIFVHAAV